MAEEYLLTCESCGAVWNGLEAPAVRGLCPECACAEGDDCTCGTPTVNSASIDPPEPKSILDPWCPVHGKNPDEEYERQRDDAAYFKDAGWDSDDY